MNENRLEWRQNLTQKITSKTKAVRKDERRFRNGYRAYKWGGYMLSALIVFLGGTGATLIPHQTKDYIILMLGIINIFFIAAPKLGWDRKWVEESARRIKFENLETRLANPDADLAEIEKEFLEINTSDQARINHEQPESTQ